MLHEDRRRADSFGEDAEAYDRFRPGYPEALVDDLVAPGVRCVLDVGCGTGIASRLFATRGCDVLGVEPDARMAAVARRHGIAVHVAAFETWDPPAEPFDLVVSGQAWHWIDPAVGPDRGAGVLRDGGRLALFWNTTNHDDRTRARLDEVYERHGFGAHVPSPPPEHFIATLEACPRLEAVGERDYPWQHVYRRGDWLDLLRTASDHRVLPPDQREALLADIGAAIDDLGGSLTVGHDTHLITALRTG